MTKRVQLIGHESAEANAFIGEEREITVDTDNDEIRLHDGTTPGGHRILNVDEGDIRWQARSDELDGFLDWEPDERGILTRLGPANYVLRELAVDEDQLTLANPNGFGGNPTIGFAPAIASDHAFTGTITFTQAIQADGGIVGDVTGNTAGTHTGNVVGNVTGNLVGNASGSHTGTFTGDLNTSDHGVLMADGQILLAWLEDAIFSYIIGKGVPVGSCIPYAGEIDDLPTNWLVCDGTGGTPDLRERFVVGTGTTYPFATTGGSATHSHVVTVEDGGSHTHTGTVEGHALTISELPSHKHANGVTDNVTTDVFSRGAVAAGSVTPNSIESNGADGVYEGYTSDVGDGATHTHGIDLDASGTHSHSASSAATSTLPPYYSLVYIMKVA